MDGLAITKEYFPDLPDNDCLYILWNETGWPHFFQGDPETYLRKQLAKFKDKLVKARGGEMLKCDKSWCTGHAKLSDYCCIEGCGCMKCHPEDWTADGHPIYSRHARGEITRLRADLQENERAIQETWEAIGATTDDLYSGLRLPEAVKMKLRNIENAGAPMVAAMKVGEIRDHLLALAEEKDQKEFCRVVNANFLNGYKHLGEAKDAGTGPCVTLRLGEWNNLAADVRGILWALAESEDAHIPIKPEPELSCIMCGRGDGDVTLAYRETNDPSRGAQATSAAHMSCLKNRVVDANYAPPGHKPSGTTIGRPAAPNDLVYLPQDAAHEANVMMDDLVPGEHAHVGRTGWCRVHDELDMSMWPTWQHEIIQVMVVGWNKFCWSRSTLIRWTEERLRVEREAVEDRALARSMSAADSDGLLGESYARLEEAQSDLKKLREAAQQWRGERDSALKLLDTVQGEDDRAIREIHAILDPDGKFSQMHTRNSLVEFVRTRVEELHHQHDDLSIELHQTSLRLEAMLGHGTVAKRRFRLEPVPKREITGSVTFAHAGLPPGYPTSAFEFEQDPGKPVYVVVTREPSLEFGHGLPADGVRKLPDNVRLVCNLIPGVEVEAYELVPAEALDFVRTEPEKCVASLELIERVARELAIFFARQTPNFRVPPESAWDVTTEEGRRMARQDARVLLMMCGFVLPK